MSVKGLFKKAVGRPATGRRMGAVSEGPLMLVSDELLRRDRVSGKGGGHFYIVIGPR